MFSIADKSKLRVGYKQAIKVMKESKAEKIFLAEDCDGHIKGSIEELANQVNVPVCCVPTMKELGSMCSIDVGASCAAVVK